MSRLIIRSGRVIDPASGFDDDADVVIENGVVLSIERDADSRRGDRSFDASGFLVTPGLIDPHVHLREPGGEAAETIASGGAAAIEGGFTTVCCMPNTRPAIDSVETLELVAERSRAANACRVFAVAAATCGRRGERLVDMEGLSRAGAVGFSDDGDVIASAAVMREALRGCRAVDRVFMQHCQELTLTAGASMNEGAVADRLGQAGWPKVAEELIIERDIRLNREVGARYHVQHLSSGGSVELVREAREEGQPVSAEASPHHLLLTDEACESIGTNAKMNPPLRTAADVEAVRRGVADGVITVLATDHAPHAADRKALPFAEAPFGIVGIETALPLYVRALVESGLLEWPALIRLMTIEPAKLCGLDQAPHRLGSLETGAAGDVTVIDPDEVWTIDARAFQSLSSNTPFDGWEVRGRAVGVVVGGEIRLDRSDRSG
ncbi:MAG: dihydroorotase [Phycisphaerales bacterium]